MSNKNPQKKVKSENKKWWTKTKVWIVTITSILVLFSLILELPKKISETFEFIFGDESVTTPLRGRVISKMGNPIESAILKIDELPSDSVITTSDGGFYFAKVPGKSGVRVRLYVFCKGFKPYNEYVTLPGPVRIVLEE